MLFCEGRGTFMVDAISKSSLMHWSSLDTLVSRPLILVYIAHKNQSGAYNRMHLGAVSQERSGLSWTKHTMQRTLINHSLYVFKELLTRSLHKYLASLQCRKSSTNDLSSGIPIHSGFTEGSHLSRHIECGHM